MHIPDPPSYTIIIAIAFNWSYTKLIMYSMCDYDPEMPSNSVSEDWFFNFPEGIPPGLLALACHAC